MISFFELYEGPVESKASKDTSIKMENREEEKGASLAIPENIRKELDPSLTEGDKMKSAIGALPSLPLSLSALSSPESQSSSSTCFFDYHPACSRKFHKYQDPSLQLLFQFAVTNLCTSYLRWKMKKESSAISIRKKEKNMCEEEEGNAENSSGTQRGKKRKAQSGSCCEENVMEEKSKKARKEDNEADIV